MVTLVSPDSSVLWDTAGQLLDEYAASLPVTLEFQDFDHERANLAAVYSPPQGLFLLADDGGRFVGCGAFRRFSPTECEMKRLYVRPGLQGCGLGRTIAKALIAAARAAGYQRMLLDTLPSMGSAQALYASLGFQQVDAYRFNPVPGTAFMALDL